MNHSIHDEHEVFGKVHSFSGTSKVIYDLIRILLFEGVGFRYQPTHIGLATITHITHTNYEQLIKKGRILDPTSGGLS